MYIYNYTNIAYMNGNITVRDAIYIYNAKDHPVQTSLLLNDHLYCDCKSALKLGYIHYIYMIYVTFTE